MTDTPGKPFAALRDLENLEDRLERFGNQLDSALGRMEELMNKLNEGSVEFATIKLEQAHERERLATLRDEFNTLRAIVVTKEQLQSELKPVVAAQLKSEDSAVWIWRLIAGALILGLLALLMPGLKGLGG